MKRWKVQLTPKTKTWHAVDPHCPLIPGNPRLGRPCRCEFFPSLPAAYDYAAVQRCIRPA